MSLTAAVHLSHLNLPAHVFTQQCVDVQALVIMWDHNVITDTCEKSSVSMLCQFIPLYLICDHASSTVCVCWCVLYTCRVFHISADVAPINHLASIQFSPWKVLLRRGLKVNLQSFPCGGDECVQVSV